MKRFHFYNTYYRTLSIFNSLLKLCFEPLLSRICFSIYIFLPGIKVRRHRYLYLKTDNNPACPEGITECAHTSTVTLAFSDSSLFFVLPSDFFILYVFAFNTYSTSSGSTNLDLTDNWVLFKSEVISLSHIF